TMSAGALHVLLVRRGEAPYEGMWAIPGGFKRPVETLDEAAKRELGEETGVDAAPILKQFRAYGDPGRDPRMNVVTVAYLAVLRDVGAIVAGSDAADASLVPVSDVLNGQLDLAFDHLRILRDAVERARVELEISGIATAFVGTTFTVAASIVDPGPRSRSKRDARDRLRQIRTARGPAPRRGRAPRAGRRRGPRQGARDDSHANGLRLAQRTPVLRPLLHGHPPTEAQ